MRGRCQDLEQAIREVTKMNDFLGIVAIPVITVIVFLVAEAVKATKLDDKWIPVL